LPALRNIKTVELRERVARAQKFPQGLDYFLFYFYPYLATRTQQHPLNQKKDNYITFKVLEKSELFWKSRMA
jgi:hypothetical protein